jgi:hypothetical protein
LRGKRSARLDDFTDPWPQAAVSQLWRAFLELASRKAPSGWRLRMADCATWLTLPRQRAARAPSLRPRGVKPVQSPMRSRPGCGICSFPVGCRARVAAWYSGAARIYSYPSDEPSART